MKDKKVVIVGASSGIGKSLAKICSERGATVHLLSRSEAKLLQVQQELNAPSHVHEMNMLDEKSVNQTFADIGEFDYLSFTAVADELKLMSPVESMTTEVAHRGMEKFWGTFNCCRAATRTISKDGAMVVTSSIAIDRPAKNASIMNAASAAVVSFARALALEVAPTRVNIIAPGVVGTGVWTEEQRRENESWAEKKLPVGHLGTADELAQAYYSVLTNSYMTGSVVSVDGGLTLV